MALRRGRPVTWPPAGLTDAVDGTQSFPGACNLHSNLIPAQNQKGASVARVAAQAVAVLPDYASGPISCLFTVGNMAYGMYPSTTYAGYDRPFAYNMATGLFAPISGISGSNLPASPPPVGAWTPPRAAQIGTRVLFTHPGFPGGETANTFWVDSVANSTNGSATLTGYPFYYGIPVGSLLSGASSVIPAGATVVSQTIENINVLASGTATNNYITVASPTGIYPGQPVYLPNGQWDTVASVSGDNVTLNNITISSNFTNANVTFATSTIVMSKPATATQTNTLIAATAPISNKFGWLDFSGFSVNITGNIQATTQPIINGYFDVTGIQPGMTVTGPNIPAGTTVRAVGSLTFTINMTTTENSTSISNVWFPGGPSPASYLGGTLQPGQLIQGPGLPPGTTLISINSTVPNPYGAQLNGSLSAAAITGGSNQDFTVSATFIILSQLPTGTVNGASFTIAGGTMANPLWGAGDTQGLSLTNVPVSVSEYGGSACFGVNTTNPSTAAEVISDAGVPCQVTNASQVLTFAGGVPITASFGLPLQNELGGIVQSLIVFQGASNLQQITGSPALGNVTVNTSQAATGTLAPNSVAATPKGLLFVAPDGLRLLDFSGVVHDPIGTKGDGIVNPFVCAVDPTRIAASFSGNVYRVTVQWRPPAFLQTVYGSVPRTDDFWLHLDTGKFSGPHTCTVDVAAPWQALNSFICGLQAGRGQLWRSDPYPTPTSSYTENGQALSWTMRSILLPDDATDEANALVESSVWASMGKGSSWDAALIDDQGTTQTTAETRMGSPGVTQSQLPLYWGPPAAFRQASIQITGPSEPQTLVGSLRLRYQKLRYPLPSFPSSYEGSPFVATPAGANVIDYGADPTGTNDNFAAFAAAMAASNLIVIPPGKYLFNESFTFTIPAGQRYTFQGSGSDATILVFAAGQNGIAATMGGYTSSIAMYGMSITTKDTTATYIGLNITQAAITGPPVPPSILHDVSFRGYDGWGATACWLIGLQNGSNNFDYIGCGFSGSATRQGVGAKIFGTSSSQISIVHNFIGCSFWALNEGVIYGTYSQGYTFTACNFTGLNYGIYLPASQADNDQLTVQGCQINCYTSGITISGECSDVLISGNLFIMFASGGQGIELASAANAVIIGNNFEVTGAGSNNGIVIGTYGSRSMIITGNSFTGLLLAIWLQTGSNYVNVQSNTYSGNTTNITNSGGAGNQLGGGSE